MGGGASDDHLILVASWLHRKFRPLITTNWDLLMESQLEDMYDSAYGGDAFEPVAMSLESGDELPIRGDQLFFMEELDDGEFAWNPRWDIVVNPRDLTELSRSARPIWKIYGSPFFLACPKCRGINRWKRVNDLHVGDPCPEHPEEILQGEIVFWSETLDRAQRPVWNALRRRIKRSDMIVAVGFSGHDTYIRDVVETCENVWVVAPDPGAWHGERVNYVRAYGSDLATELRHLIAE